MSTVGTALTTWEDFLQLPDEEDGNHYELHDGEVILVPPPEPIHQYIQNFLVHWLTSAAVGQGSAMAEFFYRPAANLQFWRADVAYLPNEDWATMRGREHRVYAPPLIVEVLSPSNRRAKIERQRLVAFSAGTQEFWVIDPVNRTLEVSMPGSPLRTYGIGETVPVTALPGATLPLSELFHD